MDQIREIHNTYKNKLIKDAYADIPYSSLHPSLVDFACGRGGDMHKYFHASYRHVDAIDCDEQAISEAIQRFEKVYTRRQFNMQFHVQDLAREIWYSRDRKDTAVMNFALNYFFASEYALRTVLRSVSISLKPGGCFVGIALDGERITTSPLLRNSLFSVEKMYDANDVSDFGRSYKFRIFESETTDNKTNPSYFDGRNDDGIVEYLLDRNVLERVACEYGLDLVLWDHPFNCGEEDISVLLNLDVLFKFKKRLFTMVNVLDPYIENFEPSIFFPKLEGDLVLLMTREGLYSSSRYLGARKVVDVINQKKLSNTSNLKIVDATACCGTDTLLIAKHFPGARIHAIEKDAVHSVALKHNVEKVYRCSNVQVHGNTDCITFMDSQTNGINFLYVDAPWGGPSYKKNGKMTLFINETVTLSDITNRYHDTVNTFIFKVPNNFDDTRFVSALTVPRQPEIIHYKCRNVVKFLFIVL